MTGVGRFLPSLQKKTPRQAGNFLLTDRGSRFTLELTKGKEMGGQHVDRRVDIITDLLSLK